MWINRAKKNHSDLEERMRAMARLSLGKKPRHGPSNAGGHASPVSVHFVNDLSRSQSDDGVTPVLWVKQAQLSMAG